MKRLHSAMIWIGGIALLAATAVDTLAVVGRMAGFAVHGAIELIQAAVLVAGAIALVAGSVAGSHARVRLVVERAGALRPWLERGSELLALVFLAALLCGSLWLASDLWASHEVSELVGVPWRLLRMVVNLALAAMVIMAARDFLRGSRS